MKNKEQLLNKENWIQYLNLADDGELTNNAKANDIVSKIQQAINFIPCCKSDSEQFSFADMRDAFDYASVSAQRRDGMTFKEWIGKR